MARGSYVSALKCFQKCDTMYSALQIASIKQVFVVWCRGCEKWRGGDCDLNGVV